jgi:hypothetical protein
MTACAFAGDHLLKDAFGALFADWQAEHVPIGVELSADCDQQSRLRKAKHALRERRLAVSDCGFRESARQSACLTPEQVVRRMLS